MDKQYASKTNNAVNAFLGSGSLQGIQGAPTKAQNSPANFADSIRSAENEVSNLLHRLANLQAKLVGTVPEATEAGVGEPSDGVLTIACWHASSISNSVRRMHELIDRIENALPA